MSTTLQAIVALMVTQAESAGAPPWASAAGVIAVVAVGLFGWAFARSRALGGQIETLRAEQENLKAEHKKLAEKEKKRSKDLDEKRDEIQKLKKDLSSQRKKTHSAQEEAKGMRSELQDRKKAYKSATTSRPAFEDKSETAPVVRAEAKPAPKAEPKPAPGVSLSELENKASSFEKANDGLKARLDETKKDLDDSRREQRKMSKRVDDYRKMDLVYSGKVQTLEDRVAQLGRQMYEAVTEVAVLKGEVPRVANPDERAKAQAQAEARARADAAAKAEADAEAKAKADAEAAAKAAQSDALAPNDDAGSDDAGSDAANAATETTASGDSDDTGSGNTDSGKNVDSTAAVASDSSEDNEESTATAASDNAGSDVAEGDVTDKKEVPVEAAGA